MKWVHCFNVFTPNVVVNCELRYEFEKFGCLFFFYALEVASWRRGCWWTMRACCTMCCQKCVVWWKFRIFRNTSALKYRWRMPKFTIYACIGRQTVLQWTFVKQRASPLWRCMGILIICFSYKFRTRYAKFFSSSPIPLRSGITFHVISVVASLWYSYRNVRVVTCSARTLVQLGVFLTYVRFEGRYIFFFPSLQHCSDINKCSVSNTNTDVISVTHYRERGKRDRFYFPAEQFSTWVYRFMIFLRFACWNWKR